MKFEKATIFYLINPILANLINLIVAYSNVEIFLDNPATCYLVAIVATACSMVPLGGLLIHDIGPSRNFISCIIQAVILVLTFAVIHMGYGLNTVPPPVAPETAIYFSIVTWTTLGYGDFAPAGELRLLAAMQAALGYVFLGLIVGLALAQSPKPENSISQSR